MNILTAIWVYLSMHLTKILGLAQGTIAAVAAVDGIIPGPHLKYWMLALGLLTFWRGYANSKHLEPSS
jgi:hypothetical protein